MTTQDQQPNIIAAPVQQADRISIIDSLRGFALLGILLMNIPYFSMPWQMGSNPLIRNEWGTINGYIWYWIEMVPAGTQRALFSMLFGAGIILFITKLEKRMDGSWPIEYFIRRQLWLIVFGLFNAFILLWAGDILFHYGIIGIIAMIFWRLSPKLLLVAAFVSLVLMTARENTDLYRRKAMIHRGEVATKIDSAKRTALQQDDVGALTGFKEQFEQKSVQKEIDKTLRQVRAADYPTVYRSISRDSTNIEFEYVYFGLWDVLIFMFIGMAFFKTRILMGEAPTWLYAVFCVAGFALGLFLTNAELQEALKFKFNFYEITKHVSFSHQQISRVFRSFGVFGLLMLLYKSGWFKWLFALIRPVGQMAFTNYLTHSAVCAFIFYGFGLGKFGYLERYNIYVVVGIIWVCQIIISPIWLKYFRFGPMEWLWRSATYWRWQPLVRSKKVPVQTSQENIDTTVSTPSTEAQA